MVIYIFSTQTNSRLYNNKKIIKNKRIKIEMIICIGLSHDSFIAAGEIPGREGKLAFCPEILPPATLCLRVKRNPIKLGSPSRAPGNSYV